MPNSGRSEMEIEIAELVKNLYKYFKKVEKLKISHIEMKDELKGIRDELVEIRDQISEYRKIEDAKN